jgi:transcriptional regulator with GAF, ATPase, and Fis domain
MVGSSPQIQRLVDLVRRVAASPSAVLLRGESGTGKELLARALHEHSPRAGKPFVKVLFPSLSQGLLESELFGHVKGAFTSAIRDKVGRFEAANGGTLFLDEIGDVSPEVQTKLLRVLEEMTFERVGSSEPVQVDVRVIAATHQDLEALIRQGRFREDLYFRLNVISIRLPPLRERAEDVPELVQHFLRLFSQRCGKDVHAVDDDAPGGGRAQPGDDPQQRRLAAAGGTDHGHQLAAADLEGDVAQRLDRAGGGPVRHADAVEDDQRFGGSTFVRKSLVKTSSQPTLRGMSGM